MRGQRAQEPSTVTVAEETAEPRRRSTLNELQTQKLVLDDHALVSMTDRDGRITYVNDRFCETAGYTRDELVGQNHRLLNSGYHPKAFFADMWRTITVGRVWHGEVKNRTKGGAFYWVKSTVRAVRDEDGEIVGYASVRTDITEQKAAEHEAAIAHARLDLATRSGGIVLWDIDPRLGTVELSDSFGIITGYPLDEFPTDTAGLLNLVHPEDFEGGRQFVERLRADEGREIMQELRLRTYSRSYVWVRFSGRAIVGESGRLHAFGALSDVTAEKEAARSMSNEKLALERIVEERTRDLEDHAYALSQALDKERELNEMQRQFVAMASHEFRTPLAIIDSAAQHVVRRFKKLNPADIVESIETIRGAVRRMTNLMESTLSAAKMDAGKLRMKTADCQLRALLTDVCKQQQRITTSHHVRMDLDRLPEVIQGDHAALELVFANLLSNAAKYAPDAPEIVVRGWRDGDHAFVSVTDQGIGIDSEDMDKLFSRFFRAKSATGIAGTGIGLNLVKRLIDSHGGEITVDSAIGRGSTFTIRLPINGLLTNEDGTRAAA